MRGPQTRSRDEQSAETEEVSVTDETDGRDVGVSTDEWTEAAIERWSWTRSRTKGERENDGRP